MSIARIVGVDPHPEGGHFVLTEWDYFDGIAPILVFATPDIPWRSGLETYAVEDPRGVLFSRTSSLLWSQTCFSAGEIAERYSAQMVAPKDARRALAQLADAEQAPTKDREVRELLEVVYGADAFLQGRACPKRKNKSHGEDCLVCGGSKMERQPGILAELNSAHYRDAFVVAQHVAMRMAGVAK